jgi:hypothetical protein
VERASAPPRLSTVGRVVALPPLQLLRATTPYSLLALAARIVFGFAWALRILRVQVSTAFASDYPTEKV